MKLTIEDEAEGDASAGYVTIEAVDDDGDLIVDADVDPVLLEDVGDAYLDAVTNPDVLRALADLIEDDRRDDFDPTIGPGGPGWPEDKL
ncbi:hypothetical protein EI982_09435 [Haloplanus rallus]|uniref:Uncharacterized protein n=1 Tax=Haloplanus rallus TaxID=1816183 RepID=A0A6B9F3J3_9EURY|nr:hypothetical protein [Haloplanus rallus]QGX94996.1 hypothetical protein EI982_09435 [Haloplanus rallus]